MADAVSTSPCSACKGTRITRSQVGPCSEDVEEGPCWRCTRPRCLLCRGPNPNYVPPPGVQPAPIRVDRPDPYRCIIDGCTEFHVGAAILPGGAAALCEEHLQEEARRGTPVELSPFVVGEPFSDGTAAVEIANALKSRVGPRLPVDQAAIVVRWLNATAGMDDLVRLARLATKVQQTEREKTP